MSKKESKEVALLDQRPTHLSTEVEPMGLDELKQYIVPPRIKVVQNQSGSQFTDQFRPGDVIIVPQMVLVSPIKVDEKRQRPLDEGEPFFFTPVFFFVEWCSWNPYEMKGQMNSIRERTFDPRSPIAAKSRSDATRYEVIDGVEVRHVEHLNFIVVLTPEHELSGQTMVLTFARAEHRCGSNFASQLRMRKADIFGTQFAGVVNHRNNAKGEWYGIDALNPPGDSGVSPWVQDADRFEALKKLHVELRDAHTKGLVRPDYEPADESAVPASSEY